MSKTYKPTEHAQKVVDHIRASAGNLSLIEISWLQVAVNKRLEHFCQQLFCGFEYNEPKNIRWARKQLAEYHWISEQVVEIYRAKAAKITVKRNPILRMPMVVVKTGKQVKAEEKKIASRYLKHGGK